MAVRGPCEGRARAARGPRDGHKCRGPGPPEYNYSCAMGTVQYCNCMTHTLTRPGPWPGELSIVDAY